MDICSDDALKLDYLNGSLSENDRVRFEEHLAACPECRREIDGLRHTAAAVAGLTPPSVPDAWADAAKDLLQTKESSLIAPIPERPAPLRRRTNIFLYALISAGVTAVLVLLSWLVMGGTVQRWLPGLSTAALGITEPRVARIIDLAAMILSFCSLLFVPSIIDNIYLLVRKGGLRTSADSLAR
jgi:anti-sigma factor RsiW